MKNKSSKFGAVVLTENTNFAFLDPDFGRGVVWNNSQELRDALAFYNLTDSEIAIYMRRLGENENETT